MNEGLQKIVSFYGEKAFKNLLFRSIEFISFGTRKEDDFPNELLEFLLLLIEYSDGDQNPFKLLQTRTTKPEFLKNLQEWMKYVTFHVKKEYYGSQYVNFMFFCYQIQDALDSHDF